MKLGEFRRLVEEWIPPASAWKGDNTGIQIGRDDAVVKNVLVALDVTLDVGMEAAGKGVNLIVTHHPLFFHPLRSLTPTTRSGEIALYLTEHKINLYAAHTNLDHVRGGVSFALAEAIGLRNIRLLAPLHGELVKLSVNVPASHLEIVAKAMHRAGGGRFPKYDEASFRSEGIGTFKGMKGSKPYIGTTGVLERTREVKLEMVAEAWNVRRVVEAMLKAHPYEEAAYGVMALGNASAEHGLGAVGEYASPLTQERFLSRVKEATGVPVLRYTGRNAKRVQKVAVCGGAGYEAAEEALRQGVDAFVTADVKYHGFQEVERDLFLIDAGHYETERHILPQLAARVKSIVTSAGGSSKVFVTHTNTNPVSYY